MNDLDWNSAVSRTDEFYGSRGGKSYSDEQVDRWLGRWFFPFVKLMGKECILDLCCGDGSWSFGLLRRYPKLRITGVDISAGGIELAKGGAAALDLRNRTHFIVHDCETELPLPDAEFDLIFARGLFIYNQHNMMRLGCLCLLEHWHKKLKLGGRFVAMYGSKPERLGTYTPPEDTAGLPTNLCPRKTKAIYFRGGKYNHFPSSFTEPFFSIDAAQVVFYQFSHGRHTLISERIE